jgi:hypothetical protein
VCAVAAVLALAGCASRPTPVPPPPTAVQVKSMMAEWSVAQTRNYEMDLAESIANPGVVGFIDLSDWPEVMTTCVEGRGGLDAEYGPGFQASLPALSSKDAAVTYAANAECRIEYPLTSLREQLRTPAQLDYIYTYFKNQLIPCLRSQGVVVQPLPSSAQFKVQSENGLNLWSPYAHIRSQPGQSDASLTALKARCPALPAGIPSPGASKRGG